jgi:photosystem II stability/assembly factor-like uncharacterized protein
LFAGTEAYGLFRSDDGGRTWRRLGQDVITDAVNAIIISPEFPSKPDVLVGLTNALLISRDGGESWSNWKSDVDLEQGMASVVAPLGLDQNMPLLVGLVRGDILHI